MGAGHVRGKFDDPLEIPQGLLAPLMAFLAVSLERWGPALLGVTLSSLVCPLQSPALVLPSIGRASPVRHPDRFTLKRVVSGLDLSLHGLCPPNPTRSFELCLAVVVSCLADAVVSGR